MRAYLDHAATSPMPPEVLGAYTAALRVVGNPASIHGAGQAAREVLEAGRDAVAASIGADPAEIVLTGGGTESVNLAIKGLFWAQNPPVETAGGAGAAATAGNGRRPGAERARIVVPDAEHHATVDAVEWLAAHEGAILDRIPVDRLGRIRLDALEAALAAHPGEIALVTALSANNEVGTIQPVREIAALAAAHGVPLHLDAIAAYGQLPIDVHALGVTALSLAAHKVGGPVGVGALYLARTAIVEPLLHGGAQQRARSGTQDAAGAAAFGAAAARAVGGAGSPRIADRAARMAGRRDRLVAGIRRAVPDAVLRGDPDPAGRLPSNAHLTFPGCEGDALLFLLDIAGFAVSTGSACAAGVSEPSHVLAAMGVPDDVARGALRFTVGDETTDAEIDALVAVLPEVVAQARSAGLASREPQRF